MHCIESEAVVSWRPLFQPKTTSSRHELHHLHRPRRRQNHHLERQTDRAQQSRSFPFIRGDGTGPDIWAASERVFDAAVQKAYGGKRKIVVVRSFRGRRRPRTNSTTGCPTTPIEAFKEYLVGIKGPLTTPVGGGIRSLNVALRQMLDLYVCLRPVQYFNGVPSPVKHPGEGGHGHLPRKHRGHLRRASITRPARPKRKRFSNFFSANCPRLQENPLRHRSRRDQIGIGIKTRCSRPGTERLARAPRLNTPSSIKSARASRLSTRATS